MSRYQSLGYNQPSESVLNVSEIELNGTVYDINDSSESGINLSIWWTPSKQTSITGLVNLKFMKLKTMKSHTFLWYQKGSGTILPFYPSHFL
jgi:hypothetical protein